jgi:spermidine synthase
MLHPKPKSILGIGFGAGVSAGTFTRYPSVEKITICEIEPLIPGISTRFFGEQNYNVANDPRTHIVFDDARHYVMTTTEKFDIIASDPLDVFAKGTAALYSIEYFEAVKKRLNPGGIFTLYVPLYESDLRTVKSELATFFEAFPNATIWANTVDGRGYDMVFMGQLEPAKINLSDLSTRLARPDYAHVTESLRGIGVYTPADLFASYAGQNSDLGVWVKGSELNRDRDLRLQYLAGWGIDSRLADPIYREILSHRRPPEGLFVGTPELVQTALEAVMVGPRY